MSTTPDLRPATKLLAELITNVQDGQLDAPTPCPDYSLGDLIDHVDGLSVAFTLAAKKDPATASQAPSPDAARLRPGWRDRIAEQLADLARAWRDPEACTGMTRAGGVDLPGEVACQVALNEVVIHGWDVARASNQPFRPTDATVEANMPFVEAMSLPGEEAGREGLFGPVVDVPSDASRLDRMIGLSGRSPGWRSA